MDFKKLAKDVKEALGDSGAVISSVGCFGNPLGDLEDDEKIRGLFRGAIDDAHLFGADVVSGFAGRVRGKPIAESMDRFTEVCGRAGEARGGQGRADRLRELRHGRRLEARRLEHRAQPRRVGDDVRRDARWTTSACEWEPCHQMVKLIDPMPQLRKWVEGSSTSTARTRRSSGTCVREHGVRGPHQFAFHRTPGFGDSNWTDIISELRMGGFRGSIDIEGWHDPVYRGELEMTGQVHGLNYLKRCRGGDFIPNPA